MRLAIEARDRLRLDEVRLVPTAHPAHRPDSRVPPQRRLDWIKSATRREKGLIADDCEILRDGPSYTVDTLLALRERYPQNPFVLLMGGDAFQHLHSWNRWQQLIELAHIAVIARPGAPVAPALEAEAVLAGRRAASIDALHQTPGGSWLAFEPPLLDISSTRIRRLLRAKQSVRGLVPDAILNSMTAADVAALTKDDDATTH